jgi:hypothetical protein
MGAARAAGLRRREADSAKSAIATVIAGSEPLGLDTTCMVISARPRSR